MDLPFMSQLIVTVGLGGYIILLVAAWRTMQAHQSIADSLKEIAGKLK